MFYELEPSRFRDLISLYDERGGRFPIIRAVIDGSQPGQVFADAKGTKAFVISQFGFARLMERDPGPADETLLTWLAESGPIRPSYLLWYDPPEAWQDWLDGAGGDIRRRDRLRLRFRHEHASYLHEAPSCPDGFSVKQVDSELLSKSAKFGLALDSRFWPSAEAFLAGAMGMAVVQDGEVASLCYAAAVADGLAEVDVVTDEAFRGAGIATIAAQAFVRRCLARGIDPTWDCFTYNEGSMRLAERLGFEPLHPYHFYSFKIPVARSIENR